MDAASGSALGTLRVASVSAHASTRTIVHQETGLTVCLKALELGLGWVRHYHAKLTLRHKPRRSAFDSRWNAAHDALGVEAA